MENVSFMSLVNRQDSGRAVLINAYIITQSIYCVQIIDFSLHFPSNYSIKYVVHFPSSYLHGSEVAAFLDVK